MTDTGGTADADTAKWQEALAHLTRAGVFASATDNADERLPTWWSRLRDAAETDSPADAKRLAELLSQVASFSLRPDDWAVPYEPLISMREGRTGAPDDLSQDELDILASVAAAIPDSLVRARVCDVLALRTDGRNRFEWFRMVLDAMTGARLSSSTWHRDRGTWDRALLIGGRLGNAVADQQQTLAGLLTSHLLADDSPTHLGSVADLLSKHRLAREIAAEIAIKMRALAGDADADIERAYRSRAARWHTIAAQPAEALADRVFVIRHLIAEAEALARQDDLSAIARTAHLYERALKLVREIPRQERQESGIGNLTSDLANRIRAAGAATLGTMGVFQSDAIDLTDARRRSVEAVSGKEPLDALMSFVALVDLVAYEEARAEATTSLTEHPLQSLFSNVHYSREGRVVHRSGGQGGDPIYGEDPAIWRNMIQSYEFRISLMVQGCLSPAWVALSNEHRLTVEDFYTIARGSSIIPSNREHLLARALYYGYDGDFITAAQLAAPQVENLVRHHMRNAGESTSTLENGVEQEIGLTALMSRDVATRIFGPDVSFELRALFCGPIGPNLRNEYAHGLVDDTSAHSSYALYCWWLILRLTFVPFWNGLHDAETADSQEPAAPRHAPADSDANDDEANTQS